MDMANDSRRYGDTRRWLMKTMNSTIKTSKFLEMTS